MKRLTLLSVSIVLLTNQIYSQSVNVKDADGFSLMRVNDEGTSGSITIQPGAPPSEPGSKLYNEGGALKWNGTTLATGSSLWTLSGSDIYRSTGKVGIGTTNPLSILSVGGDGNVGATIYGETDTGVGVRGEASSSGSGGYFKSSGGTGRGVYGLASNSSGINYGGYFESSGDAGSGVYGTASGDAGSGVYGYSSHTNGMNYGGYFKSEGHMGRAVYGRATNSGEVTNYGGYFEASGGAGGSGVYGFASNASATLATYGGYFETAGSAGKAVYGESTKTGIVENYGGYFEARGNFGRGVYGIASYTGTATNYGGHFTGMGTGGIGVYGYGAGFAGYFEGRGYFSGNVGIGTSSPSSTLQVNGTTKIGTNVNVASISDIIEITGTLPASGNGHNVSYPSGFNASNTRVLSCEIAAGGGGTGWYTTGYYNSSSFSMVNIAAPHITITYADESHYHSAQFRLVLMKVS